MRRAQKPLQNERIRQVHFTFDVLKQEDLKLHQKLAMKLPEETIQKMTDFVQHAGLTQHTESKDQKIKKFISLSSHTGGAVVRTL